MIRILRDLAFDTERHYIHAVGLSTDTKPITGIITGSKFVAVDTGAGYLFDETAGEWNENQQLSEAVAAYLDEHPEVIDQAAIEAMFGERLDEIEAEQGVLKSALNGKVDKVTYLNLEFKQGNRNSSGEIQASDYRISNDMVLAPNGLVLKIHPNEQIFAYRIFDQTQTSMIGSSWISADTDFVVPVGCYYQFVVAKSNDGRIIPSELAVTFEIAPLSDTATSAYETAVDGLMSGIPAKLPIFDWLWWNKSFDSSSATIGSNDNTRLTLISPIAIKAGTQITVSPNGVNVYTTLYTDDGTAKTILARSGAYLNTDYTYTPDVDCYMMCDQKRANETNLPPSDNGVDIYVYRGIDVGPSNDNAATMPTKYDAVPLKLKWEQGAVDNSGNPVTRSDRIRAAVDISQIKAITYSLPSGFAAAVAFYNKNGGSKLRDSGWDTAGIGYRLCEGDFAYIVVHRTSDSNISPDDVTDEFKFMAAGSTMYNYDGVIKTLCHRGYDVVAPENTAISFIMAAQKRMRYVETDVRFTSDGVAVMLHDASINRTARNADGTSLSSTVNISSITYSQALEYDFGIYKGAEYAGQKILSFADFIVLCKKYDLFPIIEIKTGEPSGIVALQHIAESYGMHGQYGWIGATVYLQALIADIPSTLCIRLTGTTESSINETIGLKTANNRIVSDFSVSQFASLTAETIQTIATAGVEVGVWDILTEVDANAALNSPYVTWATTDGIDIGVAAFVKD